MSRKAKPVNRLIKGFENCELAQNDKTNVRLRKAENTLYASGFGVMLLGFWQIFELIFRLTLDYENTKSSFMLFYGYFGVTAFEGVSESFVVAIIVIALFVFSIFTLFFHYLTGRMAMQEAKRTQKRWFYLLMALALVYNTVITLYDDIHHMEGMMKSFDLFQVFGQEVNEVLLIMTALIMIYYGLRVKFLRMKITKNKQKEGR